MKTILVPCDFSMHALKGLQFAVELAQAVSGTVIVLSTVSQQQQDKEPLVSERYREEFEKFVLGVSQPARILHEIRFGKLLQEALNVIAEDAVDLVVVGTRGSRGWESTFIGSNVEKILRRSPVPVFAVNQESHLQNLKSIVLPCDFILKKHYGMSQLKKLQNLLNARLHLLCVDTTAGIDRQVLTQELREYAAFHELTKFTVNIVTDTAEKDGILHFAKEINADMIAMTTRGSADPGNMFISSVAADVVNHAHILTWTCVQQPLQQATDIKIKE